MGMNRQPIDYGKQMYEKLWILPDAALIRTTLTYAARSRAHGPA